MQRSRLLILSSFHAYKCLKPGIGTMAGMRLWPTAFVVQAALADVVLTPAGPMHASCVHRVPHGSVVTHRREGGGFAVQHGSFPEGEKLLEPCKQGVPVNLSTSATGGFRGGWQSYAKQQLSADVHSFLGSWNVPDEPKNYTGQTVFYFTGLQNIDWVPPDQGPSDKFDIIQPVLQYGPSADGGGKYWSVASWYVPLHDGWFAESIFSEPVKVEAGDKIFGNMTRTGEQEFYINTRSSQLGKDSAITVNKPLLQEQPWAYVTMESYADYNALSCDMWPTKPIVFEELVLASKAGAHVESTWLPEKKNPVCGISVDVADDGQKVTIGLGPTAASSFVV
eukprot:TRINITY_DN18985_c0_g5_i1.p1 TRINITY_DN18985_c0_g5~~TRINITY_DN18985_c0_g5_i1.p1  ORF type:complete len:337 (-),score=61.28 TRINITY_DN18985_c0_g5_i1:595-1605(-)